MNAVARVTVLPSGLVTLTATVPVAAAGVRTVSAVGVCCTSVADVAPKRTRTRLEARAVTPSRPSPRCSDQTTVIAR